MITMREDQLHQMYLESHDIARRILSQTLSSESNDIVLSDKSNNHISPYISLHDDTVTSNIDIDLIERRILSQLDMYLSYKDSLPIKTEIANLAMYSNWAKGELINMANKMSQLQRFTAHSREGLEDVIRKLNEELEEKTNALYNCKAETKMIVDKQKVEHELIVFHLKKEASHLRKLFDIEETERRNAYRASISKEFEDKFLERTLELEKVLIKERMEASEIIQKQLSDAIILENSKLRLLHNNNLQIIISNKIRELEAIQELKIKEFMLPIQELAQMIELLKNELILTKGIIDNLNGQLEHERGERKKDMMDAEQKISTLKLEIREREDLIRLLKVNNERDIQSNIYSFIDSNEKQEIETIEKKEKSLEASPQLKNIMESNKVNTKDLYPKLGKARSMSVSRLSELISPLDNQL